MLAARKEKEKEKGLLLPRCSFCGQVPAEGIHGGLKLKGMFVCRECEGKILTMEVGTTAYEDLMETIKRLFKI